MKIPTDNAIQVLDTKGELWGVTFQNNDAANNVWISDNSQGMLGSGKAVTPGAGIKILPVGGSYPLYMFCGKLFAIAENAAVDLSLLTWKLSEPLKTLLRVIIAEQKAPPAQRISQMG
jgi:hypothetical protein